MRKINWPIGFLLFFFTCTTPQDDGILLSGNIENYVPGSIVQLERVIESDVEPIDTLEVSYDGNFTARVIIAEPSFYRLNFANRQYVSLILTGEEEEVIVNAHGNDPRGFSEVSGSYDTEFKRQMDEIMKAYQSQRVLLQKQQLSARNNRDRQGFDAATQKMSALGYSTEADLKSVIRQASGSLAAIYGLELIDPSNNYAFLDSISRGLQASMPKNTYVKNFANLVESMRSLAIGAIAPEIALPNQNGQLVTLSSLKGKYVLIDFWAAWCRPCRIENPNVVRVYNQYSDRNFEILGVSLDRTKEAWLKAIEQDALPWIHISDLKFWNSIAAKTYQISSIPATYLIDPEGKIIAKNLRGSSLEAKLKKIFG